MKKLKKSEMLRRGQVEHVKAERNLLPEVDSNCIVKLYLYVSYHGISPWWGYDDVAHEDEARFYVGETVLAVESIHKHNYIHRDIKPDNLLLDRSGHMKLSDFGLCKPLDCSVLEEKDFTNAQNVSGALQSDGRPVASCLSSKDINFVGYTCKNVETDESAGGTTSYQGSFLKHLPPQIQKFQRKSANRAHHPDDTDF
ncbi:hypothetical protein YC2023_005127 [Brassica napus]